jgi:hypothetical protein
MIAAQDFHVIPHPTIIVVVVPPEMLVRVNSHLIVISDVPLPASTETPRDGLQFLMFRAKREATV